MFFNSKDVPFAVGMLAAVAAWIRVPGRVAATARSAACRAARPRRRPDAGHPGRRRAARRLLRARPGSCCCQEKELAGWARRRRVARPPALIRLLPALPGGASRCWCRLGPGSALAPGNLLDAIVYLGQFPYTADTIFAGQRYPAPAVPLAYWPTLLVAAADRDHAGGARPGRLDAAWLAARPRPWRRGQAAGHPHRRRSPPCCRWSMP